MISSEKTINMLIGNTLVKRTIRADFYDNEVLLINKISRKEYIEASKLFTYKLKVISDLENPQKIIHKKISIKKPLRKNILYYYNRTYFSSWSQKIEVEIPAWYTLCYIERNDGYYEIFPFIEQLNDAEGAVFIRNKTFNIFHNFCKLLNEKQTTDIYHLRDTVINIVYMDKL